MDPQTTPAKNKNLIIVILVLIIVVLGVIIGLMVLNSLKKQSENNDSNSENNNPTVTPIVTATETISESHSPDHTKLPLGDSKYTDSAKKDYVFSCQSSYNGGGAFAQGPWINTSAGTWDLTKKISVDGNVSWSQATWNATASGDMRTIQSANVPLGHNTGNFPISASDDAYSYDRNPNSIAAKTISFQIPKDPTLLSTPKCVGGEVGIATTGVLIFNAFDAGGRDAVATEIQDSCEGHPQAGSYYHYHGVSSCFKDNAEEKHSDLQGYAFDGFGIYGVKGEDGKELSSEDLDECHGHTHEISWDGETKEMFHYHFTNDFPYTVSCFRGTPSVNALSSGEGMGGGGPRPPR